MSGSDVGLPAWSAPFASDRRDGLRRAGPFGRRERSWAFGDGLGSGVTVAPWSIAHSRPAAKASPLPRLSGPSTRTDRSDASGARARMIEAHAVP